MTHTERNVNTLKIIRDIAEKVRDGEYEDAEATRDIQSMLLVDISQSLAFIADTLEKRDKKENK